MVLPSGGINKRQKEKTLKDEQSDQESMALRAEQQINLMPA